MTRPNLTLLFEPRPFPTIFSTCGRTVRLIYVQVIVSILLSLYFSSTKSSLNWNIWKAIFFCYMYIAQKIASFVPKMIRKWSLGVSISTDDRQNKSATLLTEVGYFSPLNWKLEIKCVKLKKYSVRTYIKIQFAGPRQTFCFRFKIFKKIWDLMYITCPNCSKIHDLLYSI